MKFIFLALAAVMVVAALGGSTRMSHNPNARIGLYFLAAAAGVAFVGILLA